MLRYRSTLSERSETKGIALLLAAALLSACGGGARSALVPGGTKSTSSQPGTMTIRFTMPGAPSAATKARMARGRKYVSYSSNGVTIVGAPYPTVPTVPASGATINVGSTNGEAFDVSLTSPNCTVTTSPARICTLSLPVPPGNYNFILTFWDAKPTVSTKAPVGSVLSQSPTVNQAVISGQSNTLGFTFNPEVSSAQLNLSSSVLPFNNTTTTVPTNLSIVLKDADGNVIVDDGTGNSLLNATGSPLTLTLTATDTNGTSGASCTAPVTATTLTATGWPTSGSGTGTLLFAKIPTSPVTVTYQGNCVVSSALALSGGITASTTLHISGISQEIGVSGMTAAWRTVAAPDDRVDVFGINGTSGEVQAVNPITGAVSAATTFTSLFPNAAMSGSDGNVWVALNNSATPLQEIEPIAPSTLVVGTACTLNNLATGVNLAGITQDSSGNFWVTDQGTNNFLFEESLPCGTLHAFTTSLAAPGVPTVNAAGAGTIAVGTYNVYLTWTDAAGETIAGTTSGNVLGTGANDFVITPPTAPVAATGYNVYVCSGAGCASTAATLQNATPVTPATSTYTISTTPTVTGAKPPLTNTSGGSGSQQIVDDAVNGNVWYTQYGSSTLAVVQTSSGVLQHEYATATAAAGPGALARLDATHLVYTEAKVNKVAVVDTTTGLSTECALNAGYAPSYDATHNLAGGIVVGADGNVYFTEQNGTVSAIGQWVISALPACTINDFPAGFSASAAPFGLAADTDGGNLWAAEQGAANVARFWLP